MLKTILILLFLFGVQTFAQIPDYPESICEIQFNNSREQFKVQNQDALFIVDDKYRFRVLFYLDHAKIIIRTPNALFEASVALSEPGRFTSIVKVATSDQPGFFWLFCEEVID